MPAKLLVQSTPKGASITIDKRATKQVTDYTFVVSPGRHTVVVIGANLPKCSKPLQVSVASGSVTTVSCTEAGWSK